MPFRRLPPQPPPTSKPSSLLDLLGVEGGNTRKTQKRSILIFTNHEVDQSRAPTHGRPPAPGGGAWGGARTTSRDD